MSFKNLKKQSSLGSLTQKLVKEVEKMNTTGGVLMSVSGNLRWTKQETVMPFCVFYQHQKGKIFPGPRCIHMHSKDLVVGTLKTP